MSKKRDSASFPDEEKKKKMKLDISPSSGSASDVKQEEGGLEEGVIESPASAVVDNQGSLNPLMENKPRIQDDKDFSSGSVPASTHDHDAQTKKVGSSSSSLMESGSCSSIDQPSSNKNERTLVYKKTLNPADVYYGRLMIPLETGKEFLPKPEKYKGTYNTIELTVMDHKRELWVMEASFDELSKSYMLWLNWDKYVKKFELEPEDVIFFYDDPTMQHCFLIECEKRKRDSNPKETT